MLRSGIFKEFAGAKNSGSCGDRAKDRRQESAFTFEQAMEEMGQCRLGDKRRTARLLDSARRISQHPGGSLPEKLTTQPPIAPPYVS